MNISEKLFLNAKDIAKIVGTSEASAYRIIKELNEELKKKGKVIFPGKISKRYFEEKVYM
ncbi:helix-turn-helix domain-containing protein [Fusobacterium varium]|uniref:helix-turn-helix domain-containing protein n=1 Tax=Fusobacterium varium TaxID=856 RepID=UPI0027DBF3B5|nr:helix-turn-helix domain-containing protein [uncultured Fusobacterium sp.]